MVTYINSDGVRFCENCGAKVSDETDAYEGAVSDSTNNDSVKSEQPEVYDGNVRRPDVDEEVSVGDWILSFVLLALPVPFLGVVMLFIWAFEKNTPKSKSNWAKAMLIFTTVLLLIIGFLFKAIGMITVAFIKQLIEELR